MTKTEIKQTYRDDDMEFYLGYKISELTIEIYDDKGYLYNAKKELVVRARYNEDSIYWID